MLQQLPSLGTVSNFNNGGEDLSLKKKKPISFRIHQALLSTDSFISGGLEEKSKLIPKFLSFHNSVKSSL